MARALAAATLGDGWPTIAAEVLLTVAGSFLVGWILFQAEAHRALNDAKTAALLELRSCKFNLVGSLLEPFRNHGATPVTDLSAHEVSLRKTLREACLCKDKYAFMAMADSPKMRRDIQALFKAHFDEYEALARQHMRLLRDRLAGRAVDPRRFRDQVYRNSALLDEALASHFNQHRRFRFWQVLFPRRRSA